MTTKGVMGIAALALSFTLSAAVQAQNFPGEYHIIAAGNTKAKGWFLATSKDQLIASNKIGGIRWKFEKAPGGENLFYIIDGGVRGIDARNYMIVTNGKLHLTKQKPGPNQGRWVVQKAAGKSGNYAITYKDDGKNGGNALSLPDSDTDPVKDPNLSGDLSIVYKAGIEWHNEGGQGHEHQQWEIRKRD